MKFLERRDPIEAVCWDGNNKEEIWAFCNYAKFTQDMNGNTEVLIPIEGGKTFNVTVGDFLTKDERGVCIPYRRNDFLYKYDEYTPEIPRVTLNCDLTELDDKKQYLCTVEIPKNMQTMELVSKILESGKQNFDAKKLNAIMVPDFLRITPIELAKNGIYLIEFSPDMDEVAKQELLEAIKKELKLTVVLTHEDSIKLTRLEDKIK